ncbi:glycosyltransferase family 4 protein [Winogradskyella ursingii]|uniref:glycosyltransferase family 4 protein n=1 Tax=Winogradskyella ursingii TaxID=2686079 RepID=UPI0015CB1C83|nr:glycosyltransferase family 4 protein [Winogradskyella ursingii]
MKDKKNKIGFVIGALSSGGAERVISTLSNELIEHFDVVIITFLTAEPFYPLDERVEVIPCTSGNKKPSSGLQSLQLNYSLVKKVSNIVKIEKIDLLIGFITSANIIAVIAAKLNGIPSIISERNNPQVENVPKFWVFLRKHFYHRADRLVLQTQGVKNIYKESVNAEKLLILPNPISSDLSNKRDISVKKDKLILTVGRLIKNKCHDDLINAFKTINPQGWKLVIIGTGSEKKKLNQLIIDLDLSDRVTIMSKVKDIHNYYNKASIFVFTSKTEGFPNALLEAMHFGLPAISSDCNFGPSDLIVDGENGFLIKVNDKNDLVEKLMILLKDKQLQQQFSENAKKTTEDYVSEKVVLKWRNLINSLLK